MGKHEPNSAKAISIKMKAKGLQKIKYYCEMCKKQCRDDNGFKCHITSEAHQRQALIVSENPEKFVSEFSNQFMEGFMYLLKARYRSKRVLANTVFQDYIKEKDHIHMNGTRWTTLTDFAHWLGDKGLVKVDESERGVMVTYIDRDPETLRRQELDAKRKQREKEMAERNREQLEKQKEATKHILRCFEEEKEPVKPIPIERIVVEKASSSQVREAGIDQRADLGSEPSGPGGNEKHSSDAIEPMEKRGCISDSGEIEVIERPVFQVSTVSIKSAISTNYKPPPPKRRVIVQKQDTSNKRFKPN